MVAKLVSSNANGPLTEVGISLLLLVKFTSFEVGSVVPISIPVSVYGYLGLLRSSLGEEMAHVDIAMLS
jgi:hypothetical protein